MMDIRERAVVFDNNAYGDVCAGTDLPDVPATLQSLRNDESRLGIDTYVSPIVLMELAALLSDPTRPAFGAAYKALVGIAVHCAGEVAGESRLRTLQDPESAICRLLFGESPPGSTANTESLSRLCFEVRSACDLTVSKDGIKLAGAFADHVASTEAGFACDVFESVVKHVDPSAESWGDVTAQPKLATKLLQYLKSDAYRLQFGQMQVLKASQVLGKSPTASEQASMAQMLANNFGTPIAMYSSLIKRVVLGGANIEKKNRTNWIWDMYILFGADPGLAIDGKDMLLVTSDKAMLEAAAEAGAASSLISLADYREAVSQA